MQLTVWDMVILGALAYFLVEWKRAPLRIKWFEMLLGVGTPITVWLVYMFLRTAGEAEAGSDALVGNMEIVDFLFLLLIAGLCAISYQKLQMLHLNRVASGEPWD